MQFPQDLRENYYIMETIKLKESDVEGVVIQTLRVNGYEVWKLGGQRNVHRVFLSLTGYLRGIGRKLDEKEVAGFRRALNNAVRGHSENDTSAPDLIIRHHSWPHWCLMGLEVKGPTTVVSAGQQENADANNYPIGRGIAHCLNLVIEFDDRTSPEDAQRASRRTTNLRNVADLYK